MPYSRGLFGMIRTALRMRSMFAVRAPQGHLREDRRTNFDGAEGDRGGDQVTKSAVWKSATTDGSISDRASRSHSTRDGGS
jgi:hypothetical protein